MLLVCKLILSKVVYYAKWRLNGSTARGYLRDQRVPQVHAIEGAAAERRAPTCEFAGLMVINRR